jgi:hypothetical protein
MKKVAFAMPALLGAALALTAPGQHLVAAHIGIPGWSASVASLSGNYCAEIIYFDGNQVAAAVLSPGSRVEIDDTSTDSTSGEDAATIIPPDTSSASQALARATAASISGLNVDANIEAFWNLQNAADSAQASGVQTAESAAVAVVPQQLVNDEAGVQLPVPDCSVSPPMVAPHLQVQTAAFQLPLGQNFAKAADNESNIYDSGCLTANGHHTNWAGCYTRTAVGDRDINHWYSLDRSNGIGHGTFWGTMTYGNSQQNYGGSTSPVKWNPTSKMGAGSCHQVSFGLSFGTNPQGSVSDSFQVCPSNVEPHWGSHQFHATWNGSNTGGSVGEANEDLASTAEDASDNFSFSVHKGWHY